MNEDRLGRALRKLPRSEASAGFTARVVAQARADSSAARTSRNGLRLALLAAAVVSAVIAVPLLRGTLLRNPVPTAAPLETASAPAVPTAPPGEPEREERVREMRSEYAELQQELLELQRLAAAQRPVVGLEGNENDYLIDLRNLYTADSRNQRLGNSLATPASYRPTGRP